MALTDKTIKNAKHGVYSDFAGLYLRVHPTGKKVFVYRDQSAGKNKWYTLGQYPAMTLAAARERATEIKSGVVAAKVMSFQQAFDVWYAHIEKQHRRPELVMEWFKANVLPVIGKRNILDLSRVEYTTLLQTIVSRGSPVMANRVFSQLKSMLGFCSDRGYIKDNCLAGVQRKNIGGKEKARTRALTFTEIENCIRTLRLTPMMQTPLYLMLLTGLRSSEAIWVLKHKQLHNIPTKGELHRIPPIPAVRALLLNAPQPPSESRAMAKTLKRLGVDFTPHDLRRTFATRLGDLGVMPHVVEKLLGHKMEGVMAVYNRAEFWQERTDAMKLWARTISDIRKKARS
jgi:integrase